MLKPNLNHSVTFRFHSRPFNFAISKKISKFAYWKVGDMTMAPVPN